MNITVMSPGEVDLTSCDREPIHIPGNIQPHGFLFVLAPETLQIRQMSVNAGQILGPGWQGAIGRPLPEVLEAGETLYTELRGLSRDGGTGPKSREAPAQL